MAIVAIEPAVTWRYSRQCVTQAERTFLVSSPLRRQRGSPGSRLTTSYDRSPVTARLYAASLKLRIVGALIPYFTRTTSRSRMAKASRSLSTSPLNGHTSVSSCGLSGGRPCTTELRLRTRGVTRGRPASPCGCSAKDGPRLNQHTLSTGHPTATQPPDRLRSGGSFLGCPLVGWDLGIREGSSLHNLGHQDP